METIGERIRDCRIAAGLTVEELADRSGVSAARLRKWENYQGEPSARVLVWLCRGLGVSGGVLLGMEPIPQDAELLRHFHRMNSPGRRRLLEQAEELAGDPAYMRASESARAAPANDRQMTGK